MIRNVFIMGDRFGYPTGRATVSRVRNIALGLKSNAVEAKVLIIAPSDEAWDIQNKNLHGVDDGIEYMYTTRTTFKSQNKFLHQYDILVGLLNAFRFLYAKKKADELDYVILYFRKTYTLFLLGTFLRILKVKTVVELCEWVSAFPSKSKYHKFLRDLFSNNVFRWVDGAVLISEYLMKKFDEFQRANKKNGKSFLLPILVDFNKYPLSDHYEHNCKFLFCGQLDYLEITEFLLHAFALVLKNEPNAVLYMVGNADNPKNFAKLTKLSEELSLGKSIIFTGFVTDEELVALYNETEVLLLPLPNDERTTARFPTKIGEYLSTGKPIVVSKQGDIKRYLVDGESCFFVDEFIPEKFAEKMIEALSNFELSKKIGIAGRKIAETNFSADIQCKHLNEYLEQL